MHRLKQQGDLNSLTEFQLLEIAMEELADKKKTVLATDYENDADILSGAAQEPGYLNYNTK